ncbi:GDP-fucose protein O-fucosyltransferase [Dillenia turbinata]|uniref:O-fucosyltransferase family protein n=1 Tax=Dillenia turbinata TaxID=194707 RepID=A0AAN8VY34_9MAGN
MTTNGCATENNISSCPPSSPRRHAVFPIRRRRHLTKTQIHFRRNLFYFVLLPLLYISGAIMCFARFFSVLHTHPALPGSVYRSPEMFQRFWTDIQSDNSSTVELASLWRYDGRRLKEQKPCTGKANGQKLGFQESSFYLIIEANGGLNQQRSSICNAVAVAGLLNATLVLPRFEYNSVWLDPSEFGDIYDVDHFITTLEGHVKVVQELPHVLMEKYNYNISNVPNFRVQALASSNYYLKEVYPILHEQGVVRIAPFASRLAMDVPLNIQMLRCLTNYKALRFSPPISTLAKKLVDRMIEKSKRTGGKYISVHLRFEEDMVAFSCCSYDGGRAEKFRMDSIREKGWKGKFTRPGRVIRPDLNRVNGKCPLTPVEVGMMLRGMGFSNNTSIYLASGPIYQAERNLAPLLQMFPLLQTKESLATPYELASFMELKHGHISTHSSILAKAVNLFFISATNASNGKSSCSMVWRPDLGYSSRLAALDYSVSLQSEVFVTTQGGNFPQFVMGHRRFLNGGHSKTIKPDKRKLVVLLQDTNLSWNAFKEHMEEMLEESDHAGMTVPKSRKSHRGSSIYEYPFPECSSTAGLWT